MIRQLASTGLSMQLRGKSSPAPIAGASGLALLRSSCETLALSRVDAVFMKESDGE